MLAALCMSGHGARWRYALRDGSTAGHARFAIVVRQADKADVTTTLPVVALQECIEGIRQDRS